MCSRAPRARRCQRRCDPQFAATAQLHQCAFNCLSWSHLAPCATLSYHLEGNLQAIADRRSANALGGMAPCMPSRRRSPPCSPPPLPPVASLSACWALFPLTEFKCRSWSSWSRSTAPLTRPALAVSTQLAQRGAASCSLCRPGGGAVAQSVICSPCNPLSNSPWCLQMPRSTAA